MALALIVCFAAGYGISALLFHITGNPPELLAHIISSLIGAIIFSVANRVFSSFRGPEHNQNRSLVMKNTIEAMNRIAHGDFSVSLSDDKSNPYNDLTVTVNHMADQLRSMDVLRQDFVSNVSHEIQSPLTSIGGYVSLLDSDSLSPEQRKHYIAIIKTETSRLSKLSSNLLKLSSLNAGLAALSFGNFRLDKQLQNITILLEPQWSAKNISIDASLDRVEINADEELLSQVWINLIHNAIKFTPEGGTIQIKLTLVGDIVRCVVTDSGIGIAPEDQPHIFERFFKADRSRDRSAGGNGLGLSLVRKVVELHNGTVTVESELGNGSSFTVQLPIL